MVYGPFRSRWRSANDYEREGESIVGYIGENVFLSCACRSFNVNDTRSQIINSNKRVRCGMQCIPRSAWQIYGASTRYHDAVERRDKGNNMPGYLVPRQHCAWRAVSANRLPHSGMIRANLIKSFHRRHEKGRPYQCLSLCLRCYSRHSEGDVSSAEMKHDGTKEGPSPLYTSRETAREKIVHLLSRR